MQSRPDRHPGTTVFAVIVATLALVVAGLELWVIVDGISFQPNNCYLEASTKWGVLGVYGGPVVLISLGTAAYAVRAVRTGNRAVSTLTVGLVLTIAAFLFWAYVWLAAFGC
jgi:hypothetical protein